MQADAWLNQVQNTLSSLYPLGPNEQSLWERAGGDARQLDVSGNGMTQWRRAFRELAKGVGGVSAKSLLLAALDDYSNNTHLQALSKQALHASSSTVSARPSMVSSTEPLSMRQDSTLAGGDMTKQQERILAYGFGVFFVATVLIIALFIPNPSPFRYEVFKIVLAIACAGVAAFIPGFLNVEVGRWVRAGGAIAVFIIIFFFSPAKLATDTPEPITHGDMYKAIELGQSLEYVKDEIDNHISYKNGDGEFDDMSDMIYTNEKMTVISNLEYLAFNRNDELSMLRTRTLSQWEGVNEAWELISRFEGFLEKKSKVLFYLYRSAFIAERIHATIQENPNEDISTWHAELVEYVAWLVQHVDEFKSMNYQTRLNNQQNDLRYTEWVEALKRKVQI